MGIYDDEVIEEDRKPIKPSKKKKPSKQKKEIKIEEKIVVDHSQKIKDFYSSIKPVPEYIKHLLECRCILPQYADKPNPPNHKFIAFSELDEYANVKQSYAQCNNCGIIHRITEVGTSYTIKKESMMSIPNIEDIKQSLPDWLIGILEKHQMNEIHTWQEAKFIMDNQLWGRFIVLAKEKNGDLTNGKFVQILGRDLHKIDFFERDDTDATR